MATVRRPRVAAIGLDDHQVESIAPLCGNLRTAEKLREYLKSYSWTETDIVVSSSLFGDDIDRSVNLLTIGFTLFHWDNTFLTAQSTERHYVATNKKNTEREVKVPSVCPDYYRPLATELSRQLARSKTPASVVNTLWQNRSALIETTSGLPVAMRLVLPARSATDGGVSPRPLALLLPEVSNLAAWFRAFLYDVHKSDPERVPHPPPRLVQPSDWHTPQERYLAEGISRIESDIERLSNKRDQLRTNLDAEGERADKGIRRILWADGDELVAAAKEVLDDLGFEVHDMDVKLREGEPKREDLRLTLPDRPGWQAMVEVKGYTNGTKTTDARQIREHRDRYIEKELRSPDLTVWLANPFRTLDPSSRSAPDQNVEGAAEIASAVHVQASDLYRQWTLVAAGRLEAETVVQSLVIADPGLWTPLAESSGA